MLPFSNKYLTDEFSFKKAALIRITSPLDFTNETSVNGFEIGGTEPEGTRRRIIFEIDGALYKFGTNGLDEYEGLGTLPDILEMGNTVGELLALEKIPQFVGKKVYPIIAMDAPADSPVFPRIKLAVKVQSYNDIYTCYRYSPEYRLTDSAKIINAQASKVTRGNGVAKVQCRLKSAINDWGEWINLEEAQYKEAVAIQFRVQYILSAIDGSDYALVSEVNANYSTDASKLPGAQEIICQPQEYNADLGTCYALINHSKLIDCSARAFIKFEKPLTTRINNALDGQVPYLAFNGVVDTGIVQDTLHVEAGGIPIDGVYYDTESAALTFDSAENVSASYQCGLQAEDWREMALDFTTGEQSRFIYRLTEEGWRISAVKFVFERQSGSVNEIIGTGDGKLQIFPLAHKPRNITCNAPFKCDGVLKVLAPIGERIYLSYDYSGEVPLIKDYLIGWEAK